MEKLLFGTDKNNKEIYSYTLYDNKGNYIKVLNLGATLQSVVVKNKKGEMVDTVLGFDNLEQYQQDKGRSCMGAVCGRVCGRIPQGRFFIEGVEYQLDKNAKEDCLHSGYEGLDKQFFDITDVGENYMTFSIFEESGKTGFPGNLSLSVKYTFNNGLLLIEYLANVTQSCPVNITNHSYFNLDGKGDVKNHNLQLNSDFFMQMDEKSIADGNVLPVANTCFDLRQGKKLGEIIEQSIEYQPHTRGFDQYLFNNYATTEYRRFGTLTAGDDSLKMDIFTNQCGAQLYTANFLQEQESKTGENLYPYRGIAIETQSPPNAISFSHLPSPILKRGQSYYHKTGYRFYFE